VNAPNVSGLIYDLRFAYGFPVLVFIGFWLNRRLSRKSRFNPLLLRISIAFCLTLFASVLGTLLYQDRIATTYLSTNASALELLVYIAMGVLTAALFLGIIYWKLRPSRRKRDWTN
jgi:hypothetical protein